MASIDKTKFSVMHAWIMLNLQATGIKITTNCWVSFGRNLTANVVKSLAGLFFVGHVLQHLAYQRSQAQGH